MTKKWLTPEHEHLLRNEPNGNPFELSQAVDDAARDRRYDLLPFIELHLEAQEEMLRASALSNVVAPLLVVKHVPKALAAIRADPDAMVRLAIAISFGMYLHNEEPYRTEIMSTLALVVRDDPHESVRLGAYRSMKSFTRAKLKTFFEPGEPVVFDQDFLAKYLPS